MRDPTQRFTSRVGNYDRYRPSYPRAILSELFLENGNRVFGVEPKLRNAHGR